MSETFPGTSENISGMETLQNILDWAKEGPGQHNFLRIMAESIDPQVEALLAHHGYRIERFFDPSQASDLERLERLHIDAQLYMNFLERKVAVFVSSKVRKKIAENPVSQGNWALNSQYMDTVTL